MKPQLYYTMKNIGGRASLWIGTFTSVRIGWKPMLNVDMANKVVYDKNYQLKNLLKTF